MILPQTYSYVLALMILSVICLGSWASTFKMAGKWRFELFYFDFAIGLMIAAVIYALTFGNLGFDGFTFLDDLQHAGKRQWMFSFLAGLIFNLANMLLVGAVSVAGLSVSFPITVAIAVLVGTGISAVVRPAGSPLLLLLGCLLLLTSVMVNAMSYRLKSIVQHEALARQGRAKSTRRPSAIKGVILAMAAGLLMGSFTPLLDKARAGEVGMGPYALVAMFALGVLFTTPIFNIFFMNLPVEGDPIDLSLFFTAKPKQHIYGLIGGIIWCTGMLAAIVAGSAPDTAQGNVVLHFLLGHSWPLIAALWGVLVFGEARAGDLRLKVMTALMMVLFLCGLAIIAIAPMYIVGKS